MSVAELNDYFNKRLIAQVECYPHLFDTSHPKYKDSKIRTNSFESISRLLKRPVKECIARWKSLRDQFVKAVRMLKKPPPSGCSTYELMQSGIKMQYADQMKFLLPHLHQRRTISNLPLASKKENNQDSMNQADINLDDDESGDDLEENSNVDELLTSNDGLLQETSTLQTDNPDLVYSALENENYRSGLFFDNFEFESISVPEEVEESVVDPSLQTIASVPSTSKNYSSLKRPQASKVQSSSQKQLPNSYGFTKNASSGISPNINLFSQSNSRGTSRKRKVNDELDDELKRTLKKLSALCDKPEESKKETIESTRIDVDYNFCMTLYAMMKKLPSKQKKEVTLKIFTLMNDAEDKDE